MKKTPILLLALCCILLSETISATAFANSLPEPEKKIVVSNPVLPFFISAQDFVLLTPEKYEKIIGRKLSFFQKIAFRLKQQKIKRMLKKGEAGVLSDFDPTGFVLGLFVSVIGIGISYLINYKDTKKWAWIGAAVSGVFILIAILL